MNIADKKRLYQECARLLMPCGRIALNDIVAGPTGPPHFPEPWARDPSTSFLESAGELRGRLTVAGFHIVAWEDKTGSEEQTSELQSLMRISYAVFSLKNNKYQIYNT